MLHPVAHNKVLYLQDDVVAAYLVKGLLCDLDVWRFVFSYQERLEGTVVQNRIASARHPVQLYLLLVTHVRERVAFLLDEKVHEMLSNPFFGRQ